MRRRFRRLLLQSGLKVRFSQPTFETCTIQCSALQPVSCSLS